MGAITETTLWSTIIQLWNERCQKNKMKFTVLQRLKFHGILQKHVVINPEFTVVAIRNESPNGKKGKNQSKSPKKKSPFRTKCNKKKQTKNPKTPPRLVLKGEDSPGPGSYVVKSTWGTRGISFGKRYTKSFDPTPGPGAYKSPPTINQYKSKGCTFGKKLYYQTEPTPGPGEYNSRQSTYLPKKKGCTFGKKIIQRIHRTPGPGAYHISPKSK